MAHTRLRITDRFGRIAYQFLQHGRPGTVQTLREMAELVRNDVLTDEGLQDYANKILVKAGVGSDVFGNGSMKEIKTIFEWVRDRIIYRKDPTGGHEAIQDARVTLQRGYGDCDDFSVTLAVLLGLVGYVTRFVVVRVDPQGEGFQHVYLEVKSPRSNKWLALDATNKNAIIGWETKSIERRTFQIFGAHPTNELEGFKKVFKKIGKGAAKVGKKVAPIAAGFIPVVGQFASQGVDMAISAGESKAANKRAQQEQAAAEAQQAKQQRQTSTALALTNGRGTQSVAVSPAILIGGGIAALFALTLLARH
jgi:hypothetical protein